MNACLWVFFFNVFSPYKNFSKVTSSHYQKRLHSLDWQCYLHFPLQETPGFIICPSLIPVNFTESDFKDYLSLFFFLFPIFIFFHIKRFFFSIWKLLLPEAILSLSHIPRVENSSWHPIPETWADTTVQEGEVVSSSGVFIFLWFSISKIQP